jgi:hypothetical protein
MPLSSGHFCDSAANCGQFPGKTAEAAIVRIV